MLSLKINNQQVSTERGKTIFQVAKDSGIDIPNLCNNDNLEHFNSCMICLVKDKKTNSIIPSCSALVSNNMEIITEDEEIKELRKKNLELLLSEHVGDCEAPCRIACPAFMDIPLMNRLISEKKYELALEVVRKDIALPGVIGRICPAPCENACKRKFIDDPVSICLLKRFSYDIASNHNINPTDIISEKKIAVIGAGPAGISAAFYLRKKGLNTVVFEKNALAGGALRYSIEDKFLDKDILNKEIEYIAQSGVKFILNTEIKNNEFKNLLNEYDAIILATGNLNKQIEQFGLKTDEKGLYFNKKTYQTGISNVFAIGNTNRKTNMAIHSMAQAKNLSEILYNYLLKGNIIEHEREFNSSTGKITDEEYSEYLKEASKFEKQTPSKEFEGYNAEEAQKEASRCMHCDCRSSKTCKLRKYSDFYKANKKTFAYSKRKNVVKNMESPEIVFEQGKCIKCGICVRLSAKLENINGFTFINRGVDMKIDIPFYQNLNNALEDTAKILAKECPTGAIAEK